MEKFLNYQIEVQLENGPMNTEIATVILEGELAKSTGWKKRVFICKAQEEFAGKTLKPIHVTHDHVEIRERNISGINYEIQLNSIAIRLFRQRWPGMTRWLKKF